MESDPGTNPVGVTLPQQVDTKKIKRCSLPPQQLRIFTLNVWGLQTAGKQGDLKIFLDEFQVHVGIITGTHLLRPEVMNITLPGYKVLEADGKYRTTGGVSIIAANTVSSGAVPEEMITREGEISMRSCLIYPHHTDELVVRLTGVYTQPSADATIGVAKILTEPRNQARTRNGEVVNHVIADDFNQHTWKHKTDDLY